MIYKQVTYVAINKPEDGSFTWFPIKNGFIVRGDNYDERTFIYTNEEKKTYVIEDVKVNNFLKYIRDDNSKYFKIKKRLFSRKEYLRYYNTSDGYTEWDLDSIEKIDLRMTYTEMDFTLDDAKKYLRASDYLKMLKDYGVQYV